MGFVTTKLLNYVHPLQSKPQLKLVMGALASKRSNSRPCSRAVGLSS
jgi:hypothetical protein